MTVRALVCPSCGAPLPEHAWKMRVTCAYCHAAVVIDSVRVDSAELLAIEKRTKEQASAAAKADAHGVRVSIAGETYFVRGRIARGESSDVFWAEKAWPPSLAIVKVLRSDEDRDLFAHEEKLLRTLASALEGTPGLARRVPRIAHRGELSSPDAPSRPALVVRFSSGFVHTFADVRNVHGDALSPRHLVWMWRRVLELLVALHGKGLVHGAIVPAHLLVHARDHGVNLVGWSCGGESGTSRARTAPALEAIDLDRTLLARPITPAVDLAMSARSILFLAGASDVPAPLRDLLLAVARGDFASAHIVEHELMARARTLFGPPSYEKLVMPGWT